MARVTGLGGVFYKVEDSERTARWYKEVLGVGGDWGAMFPWKAEASGEAYSLLTPFKATSDYFAPSDSTFMINLRVDDLDAFTAELEGKGVEILGRQSEEYGKFAWILDCDGIKIELWEQIGPSPV
ncbi:VOC family protein [Sphingosinicella sp. BN140058]|uniref:VOC family protein n=1 Tax=Sphingosinicella sp. BN140058 TaxID=1892855 RepID=UPI001013086C|nr:VOC family protein [Sphingosinicella sp. BN140058]QAY77314.1 VOC family protein [Sphingosinicella sp. BN140058]